MVQTALYMCCQKNLSPLGGGVSVVEEHDGVWASSPSLSGVEDVVFVVF